MYQLMQQVVHSSSVDHLVENSAQLNESYRVLIDTIKDVLEKNVEIPLTLAATLARIVFFMQTVDELVQRKQRYQKYNLLKKVRDKISADVSKQLTRAAGASAKADAVTVDVQQIANAVLDNIHGNARVEIQAAFGNIIKRAEITSSNKHKLEIMKLTSRIVRSNNDTKQRQLLIDEVGGSQLK